MNKERASLTVQFLLACLLAAAQTRIPVNHFLTLLDEGKFGTLYDEALVVRNSPGGKHYLVDYFVARALCGSAGLEPKGCKWFDHLLDSYAIPAKLRPVFEQHRRSCATGAAPMAALGTDLHRDLIRMEIDPSSVIGKLGPLGDCFETLGQRRQHQQMDLTEHLNALASRLIPVQRADTTAGMDTLRRILVKDYRIDVRKRFIIITPKGKVDLAGVDRLNAELERTADHFIRRYGLEESPYFVLAGAMPGSAALQQLAKRVHGLALPGAYYGYSSVGDMSLFASADPTHMATLHHELFHLLVRTNVGDIPPWLDEGIASLYEASGWQDTVLVGRLDYDGNYRLQALREAQHLERIRKCIPRLDSLIAMSWERFEGRPEDVECILALHYAVSKHFALYLQEEGKLAAMVAQYRDVLRKENDDGPLFRTDREMVEAATGEPLEVTQQKFEAWFKRTYTFDLY